jgi:DNA-binding GntR family transcriptional regulator
MSIAAYIKDDLAVRLLSGRELPSQLTLDSLAEHYNVSITPVRSAVAELIDEGLLQRRPNRRLAASSRPKARGRARRTQKLPEPPRDPFEIVATDLVQLSFQGEPVYLREEATAEKYDISRSAIRNIFHRLAGQGMLDHIPRRGWRLRPFRKQDLQQYVEVREVLELKAFELARPKLDPQVLQRILDANSLPESADVAPHVDESLHDYLIATADNTYIRDFFEHHGRYHRLLFRWEDHDPATAVETIRQHREIITSMLARSWSAARKALSNHILHNHPILNQVGKNENAWTAKTWNGAGKASN